MALGGYRIDLVNLDVLNEVEAEANSLNKALIPTFKDIAIDWQGKSIKSAPISPTKTQYASTLKSGKTKRSDFSPGGLERSIKQKSGYTETDGAFAEVSVASNAEAGKYGYRIHEEKGKSWNHLGPGSIAKGSGVGDKYIERPMDDNIDKYGKLIEKRAGDILGAE